MLQDLHELLDFVSFFRYTCCDRFMSCDGNIYKGHINENPNNKKDHNCRIQSLITSTQFIIINIPSGDVRLCEGI